MLTHLGPEEADAATLRDEINRIDLILDQDRDRERRARIEGLVASAGSNVYNVPFHEIPAYLTDLERMRERAAQRLAGHKPGSLLHKRTQEDLDRLEAELVYYRAVVDDPGLYHDLAPEVRIQESGGRRVAPSMTIIWVGLACVVLGALLLLSAAMVAGTGKLASGFGQVVSGMLLLGLILLIAGVFGSRRN